MPGGVQGVLLVWGGARWVSGGRVPLPPAASAAAAAAADLRRTTARPIVRGRMHSSNTTDPLLMRPWSHHCKISLKLVPPHEKQSRNIYIEPGSDGLLHDMAAR